VSRQVRATSAVAGDQPADPDLPDPDGEPAEEEPAEPALVPDEEVPAALEAVLLVVDAPVTEQALAAAVGRPADAIREHLRVMSERLATQGSGIDLREAGGGWRFYTRDRFAPVVERFVLDGAHTRLSKAALESLAVIAYRQPVTRARVAAVRGVNVDGVIRTLTARGLIEEAGTDTDTAGTLYRTTEMFLERMGLSSIEELPPLGPLLPDVDAIDDV
jgi:segregation and condensation protein B